jgi:hypothetical protein
MLGDPYVRRAVRDGLAARFGQAFVPKRYAEFGGNRAVAPQGIHVPEENLALGHARKSD